MRAFFSTSGTHNTTYVVHNKRWLWFDPLHVPEMTNVDEKQFFIESLRSN